MDKREKKEKGKTPERASKEEEEQGFVLSEEEEAVIEERRARKREEEALRQEKRMSLRPSRKSPLNGSGVYKPAIVVGIAILVIGYMLVTGICVSKSDFTKNIQDMIVTVEAVKEASTASQATVDKAVKSLSASVTTQVNTALDKVNDRLNTIETNTNSAKSMADNTNQQLSAINDGVTDLTEQVSEAHRMIGGMQTAIANQAKRITDLESHFGTDDEGDLEDIPFEYSVNLRDDGFPTGSGNTTTLSIRIILENKTKRDIEDVSMEFEVEVYGDDADIRISKRPSTSLSGWRVKEWGAEYVILKGTGMAVEDNDKYSKILNVTLWWTDETNGEAEIDDDYIEITNWSYE